MSENPCDGITTVPDEGVPKRITPTEGFLCRYPLRRRLTSMQMHLCTSIVSCCPARCSERWKMRSSV